MSKPPAARVDLLSLRLLIAAADEGNLAAAAARENIALSGVSRRIADLEQRWGVQLLHRHDRGVRPTAALESIIGRLRGFFELLDQVADDVTSLANGTRGLVRLSANMTAMGGHLGALVARFMEAHPLIDVQLKEATSADTVHALRVGTSDIGIISGTVQAEGVDVEPWRSDELVALCPAGHELAKATSVKLADILEYPFVSMHPNSALHQLYRSHAVTMGKAINERAHVGSFAMVQRLVAAGIGVAILPRIAIAENDGADVVVRPLNEEWSRRTLMLCTPQALTSSATRLLKEFLLEREER